MNKRSFNLSRLTSHLAFGFMVFFIGLNHNFSFEKDFNLKLGEKKKFEDYTIEFENINLEEFKNYKSVIGKFNINMNSRIIVEGNKNYESSVFSNNSWEKNVYLSCYLNQGANKASKLALERLLNQPLRFC